MKIISGTQKGRRLKSPKSCSIRPALAQVRESIFSSLGDVTDLVFFDVFAGTGSLGLEALSRGACRVYFIDQGPESIKLILENLKTLNFLDKAHVFKRTLPQGLHRLKIREKLDVIFCDPPYDKNLLNKTLKKLIEENHIDPQTTVIVEHSPRELPDGKELEVFKKKQFGQTLISFLKLK